MASVLCVGVSVLVVRGQTPVPATPKAAQFSEYQILFRDLAIQQVTFVLRVVDVYHQPREFIVNQPRQPYSPYIADEVGLSLVGNDYMCVSYDVAYFHVHNCLPYTSVLQVLVPRAPSASTPATPVSDAQAAYIAARLNGPPTFADLFREVVQRPLFEGIQGNIALQSAGLPDHSAHNNLRFVAMGALANEGDLSSVLLVQSVADDHVCLQDQRALPHSTLCVPFTAVKMLTWYEE